MKNIIKTTNLHRAHLMEFFGVMENISSYLKEEDLEALKIKTEAELFFDTFHALDDAVLQQRKTGVTDDLLAIDNLRDDIFTGLIGVLRSTVYFPDKAISDAAKTLYDVAKNYGKEIQEISQIEESSVLSNIIGDFKSDKYKAHVTTVGVSNWLEKLEEANTQFLQLYNQRIVIKSEKVKGLAKEERRNMQAVFEELCKHIEAYAIIDGEAAYKPLAEKINSAVSDVQQKIKARDSKKGE